MRRDIGPAEEAARLAGLQDRHGRCQPWGPALRARPRPGSSPR